jgi:cell division protease FtsH
MIKDAWLPINYPILPGVTVSAVKFDGDEFQIVSAKGAAVTALLASPALVDYWVGLGLLTPDELPRSKFGDLHFAVLTSDDRSLMPLSNCRKPQNKNEILALAGAIRRTREKGVTVSLSGSVYFEKFALLLPIWELDEKSTDDVVLGQYITGGLPVSIRSERRILGLVPWLDRSALADICKEAGLVSVEIDRQDRREDYLKQQFRLVGRPKLETFFCEHVIDIIENPDRYRPLGIDFPSAIVLHGPPGCGKTFAIERLVEYLDWPCFTIDSATIGSPFIHETGRKIADVFSVAIQKAPAIIVIDEMEAFLADRAMGSGGSTHRVEEVAEFLRRIPDASKNHVLVVGMTNRIEMIDPAILRRGRFDHVIEVNMASKEEIGSLLTQMLSERPCENDVDITMVAQSLSGRPLSDVSFVVREACRLTAKSGKGKIDHQSLITAMSALKTHEISQPHPKIGFIRNEPF